MRIALRITVYFVVACVLVIGLSQLFDALLPREWSMLASFFSGLVLGGSAITAAVYADPRRAA